MTTATMTAMEPGMAPALVVAAVPAPLATRVVVAAEVQELVSPAVEVDESAFLKTRACIHTRWPESLHIR
jgi:hypothetical protein